MAGRYEKFFKAADKDNSGYLSMLELVTVMKKQGYSESKAKAMFKSCDSGGDNKVSLEEFLQAMGQSDPKAHKAAEMRHAFMEFDVNGDGTIDCNELDKFFVSIGQQHPPEEIKRMMAMVDKDKSGTMNYEEFIKNIFGAQAT